MKSREDRTSFMRFQADLIVDNMRRFGWSRKETENKLNGRITSTAQNPKSQPKMLSLDEVVLAREEAEKVSKAMEALERYNQQLISYRTYQAQQSFTTAMSFQTAYIPARPEDSRDRLNRLAAEQGMVLMSKDDAARLVMRLEADALQQQREDTTKPVVINVKHKREFL